MKNYESSCRKKTSIIKITVICLLLDKSFKDRWTEITINWKLMIYGGLNFQLLLFLFNQILKDNFSAASPSLRTVVLLQPLFVQKIVATMTAENPLHTISIGKSMFANLCRYNLQKVHHIFLHFSFICLTKSFFPCNHQLSEYDLLTPRRPKNHFWANKKLVSTISRYFHFLFKSTASRHAVFTLI